MSECRAAMVRAEMSSDAELAEFLDAAVREIQPAPSCHCECRKAWQQCIEGLQKIAKGEFLPDGEHRERLRDYLGALKAARAKGAAMRQPERLRSELDQEILTKQAILDGLPPEVRLGSKQPNWVLVSAAHMARDLLWRFHPRRHKAATKTKDGRWYRLTRLLHEAATGKNVGARSACEKVAEADPEWWEQKDHKARREAHTFRVALVLCLLQAGGQ